MPVKLRVNAALGELDVEGDEKFVLQIYGEFKDLLKKRIAKAPDPLNAANNDLGGNAGEEGKEKKKRAAVKKSGPSCASRIAELKEEKFFSDLKDNKNISDALAAKGHNYEGKHIAAALIHMTKSGKLRRIKKDGLWYYQNP